VVEVVGDDVLMVRFAGREDEDALADLAGSFVGPLRPPGAEQALSEVEQKAVQAALQERSPGAGAAEASGGRTSELMRTPIAGDGSPGAAGSSAQGETLASAASVRQHIETTSGALRRVLQAAPWRGRLTENVVPASGVESIVSSPPTCSMMALMRAAALLIGAAAVAVSLPERTRPAALTRMVPSGLRMSWPRMPMNSSADVPVCRV